MGLSKIGNARIWISIVLALVLYLSVVDTSSSSKADYLPLIEALKDENPDIRQKAAWALGEAGGPKGTRFLVAVLKDRDPLVQWEAVWALVKIGEPAVNPLIEVLEDGNPAVRWKAIWALGEIQNQRAIEPLIFVLDDKDWNTKMLAARALGKMDSSLVAKSLFATIKNEEWYFEEVDWEFDWILRKLGRRTIEPFVVALDDENPVIRGKAVDLLGYSENPGAIRYLIMTSKDKEPLVRGETAEAFAALSRWGVVDSNNIAVPTLINLLKDEDRGVRSKAAGALTQVGDRSCVEPLIIALSDEDRGVRSKAAGALTQVGDRSCVEPLIIALSDEDRGVREAAISALGNIGDVTAVEEIISALSDDEPRIRKAATQALGRLGDGRALGPLTAALGNKDLSARWEAMDALVGLGPRAVPLLLDALNNSDDVETRRLAGRTLGRIGDARAIESLRRVALSDKESVVRYSAVGALGEIEGAIAIPFLIAALEDEDEYVRDGVWMVLVDIGRLAVGALIPKLKDEDRLTRTKTAWVLGEIKDNTAVGPLVDALKDRDADVRGVAAWALGEIKDNTAVEPLIDALKDKDADVRRCATWALGEIEDERTVEPLIRVLQDENIEVWKEAAVALARQGEIGDIESLLLILKDGVRHLVSKLSDTEPEIREVAIWTLGNIKDQSEVGSLINLLLEDDATGVRARTAFALGERRDRRAVKPLISALEDDSWEVRSEAARALGKIGDARSLKPLIVSTEDEDSDVRRLAAQSLGGTEKPEVIGRLVVMLGDDERSPRVESLGYFLGRVTDAQDLELSVLPEFGRIWEEPREGAIEALVKIGEPAVEYIIRALKNEDPLVRSGAARALGEIGDTEATSFLVALLRDENRGVREEAIESLLRIYGFGSS